MPTPRKQTKQRSSLRLSKLTFHQLNWLEYVTLGLGLWMLVHPKPYKLLFVALLCMPLIGIFLNGLNGRPSIASLVEISKNKDGSDDYDVADFIDLAAWMILLRVMLDFEFESFYSLIIPGAIACVLMLIFLFATHRIVDRSTKSKVWIYGSLVFNICLYSYAGTYGVNCVFDNSKPTVYNAQVLEKTISESRRMTRYYVTVTPWGHHYDKEQISISKEHYEDIEIGQSVKIDVKQGLFHIPWYYVERE
jgi:hypothetical protein